MAPCHGAETGSIPVGTAKKISALCIGIINSMIPIISSASSGKPCGACTKCCEGWLTGSAYGYEFKPGKPCHFISRSGCNIYPIRPEDPCKTFKCFWKENFELPDWMRPDQSGVIALIRFTQGRRHLRLYSTNIEAKPKVFEWAKEYSDNMPVVIFTYSDIVIYSDDVEFENLVRKELGIQ
jgi:hypothetical protein